MTEPLAILGVLIALLLLAAVVLLVLLLRRAAPIDLSPLSGRLDALEKSQERAERGLEEQMARNRLETGEQARGLRAEVASSIGAFKEAQEKRLLENAVQHQQQFDSFNRRLADFGQTSQQNAAQARAELSTALKDFKDSLQKQMDGFSALQKQQFDSFAAQLAALTEASGKKSDELRAAVEGKLAQLQADNAAKLEEMRRTVDEKLQSTLDKRLGESFKLVSDRLETVHKGLGEMQSLASGVGDLKRVLTNVKTRGTWGEMQLGNLLEQILTPEQFARNVSTNAATRELVDFALKLPGPSGQDGQVVWLPIDAKFPKEDYERLVEAAERGDADGVDRAAKELELRVRFQAREVRDKYLAPPQTTDFALVYLPTEGLYAEVLRRPGLVDALQREYRVVIVGPTTLAALLNSLQMGFRTLAIQQRSSEVWKVLGAVKSEFGKFGDLLDRVKKKIEETGNTIDAAAVRSRQIEKKLRKVEALPAAEASGLLADAQTLAADSESLDDSSPS